MMYLNMELFQPVPCLIVLFLMWMLWYMYDRYRWFATVIRNNPKTASMTTVLTKKTEAREKVYRKATDRVVSPGCSFRQYLKYIQLACLPYAWSVPIKFIRQIYLRQFKCNLSDYEKRQRLSKMVLETSLSLGFHAKEMDNVYCFKFQKFRMPSKQSTGSDYTFINECIIRIAIDECKRTVLNEILIDGNALLDLNEMFSFLNTVWCVYTHTLTHVMAGNIAEVNLNEVQHRTDVSDEFKKSIDNMHAAVSGMNESANHYPADIWGIPRKQLQIILGYNGVQQIDNHQTIVQCLLISNFIRFTMKARTIFSKHLGDTGISISTLSANTIFHSIDHYNMGKYFLQGSEKKSYHGIDSRMITSLLGELNYDIGHWQRMKYTKCEKWKNIYDELTLVDTELADKVHMFVSV